MNAALLACDEVMDPEADVHAFHELEEGLPQSGSARF